MILNVIAIFIQLLSQQNCKEETETLTAEGWLMQYYIEVNKQIQ